MEIYLTLEIITYFIHLKDEVKKDQEKTKDIKNIIEALTYMLLQFKEEI
jgi:hypothetical protein